VNSKPKVFLIVGCQRSGSTMVESVFNAHPKVRAIGEEGWAAYDYFDNPEKLDEVPEEWVCLRIPHATERLDHAVQQLAGARVLFMLRDPRDVVVSMRDLQMKLPKWVKERSWLEVFAPMEIKKTVPSLPDRDEHEERYRQLCSEIEDPRDVRFGGFCWLVKNRFIPLYLRSGLPTKVVRYEVMIHEPERYLRQICEHLELEWSDRLLEHGKYSTGTWFGTDKREPIHQRSVQAYRTRLTMDERRKLHSIVQSDMEMLGYVELFD
jgi:protein-tyrosine sulfotransferase